MPPYKTYILEETGSPRNHVGIFIETSPISDSNNPNGNSTNNGGGHYFNVEGTVLTGMTYLTKPLPSNPSTFLPTFEKMNYIGTINDAETADSAIEQVDAICRLVEVPGAQLNLDGSRKDERVPLRKCTEWTYEVRDLLWERGVVGE